jgi:hypothetical protein
MTEPTVKENDGTPVLSMTDHSANRLVQGSIGIGRVPSSAGLKVLRDRVPVIKSPLIKDPWITNVGIRDSNADHGSCQLVLEIHSFTQSSSLHTKEKSPLVGFGGSLIARRKLVLGLVLSFRKERLDSRETRQNPQLCPFGDEPTHGPVSPQPP